MFHKALCLGFALFCLAPITGAARQCIDVFPNSARSKMQPLATPRFLSKAELRLLTAIQESSKLPVESARRSDLQAHELVTILEKSKSEIKKLSLDPQHHQFLSLHIGYLEKQLRHAQEQKVVHPAFATDWAYRVTSLLSIAHKTPGPIGGSIGFKSDQVEDILKTTGARNFYKGPKTLKEIGEFLMTDSLWQNEINMGRPEDTEFFITDEKLGFDFFNQLISTKIQILGVIYQSEDVHNQKFNALQFLDHDLMHIQDEKQKLLRKLSFKEAVEKFVELYNQKMQELSESQAQNLSQAVFLLDHEKLSFLMDLKIIFTDSTLAADLANRFLSVSQSNSPELIKKIPPETARTLVDLIVRAMTSPQGP